MNFLKNCRHLCLRAIPLAIVITFLFVAMTGDPLTSPFGAGEESEHESEAGERLGADEWFVEQRAYPLNEIPIGARLEAIDQLTVVETKRAEMRRQIYGPNVEPIERTQPVWEAIGPQPIANGSTGPVARPASGRATAIELDPGYDGVNNQTVYLGTAQGGLWRSRDNGEIWRPLIDDQPSLAVGSLAIDPYNPNVIYVGTGEGNGSGDSYYGAGLLKTIDGGLTWRTFRGPISQTAPNFPVLQNVSISRIAIDPTNTQTIYLCTRTAATYGASGGGSIALGAPGQRGVWKSNDGGETWRFLDPVGGNTTVTANDLIIHPQNPNTILAALAGRGIYRSDAGGEPGTWIQLANGLPTSAIDRLDLAIGPPIPPSSSPTIFAAITNTGGNSLNGIFRSIDNGDSWTRTAGTPSPVTQMWYNITLEVDPRDANILYFGAVTYFRSVNGGNSWSVQLNGNGNGNGGLHVDQHAQTISRFNPRIIFAANDGGIWRSENANVTTAPMGWINLNRTLSTVQFQSVAIHPTDPNILFGGTQDNGTLRFTGDLAWRVVAGGDGGFALIDQSNPTIVWHTFQNSGTSFGPRVSMNGGLNWADRGCRNCPGNPGQMRPGDRVGFYAPLALNSGLTEKYANVVYFGTHRIYRTDNAGVTWTGLGPSGDGFGQDLSKGTGRLSAIAAHPKIDNSTVPPGEIVWGGTNDGNVQVTTSAGRLAEAVFTNVTKAPLPNRFVTDIGLDPNDSQLAYVTYSGFNTSTPKTPGHVFMTTDLGATWINISGDLPDVPVTSIAVDPTQRGTLFIGTDIGVFQTTDGGATWVRLGNGMPRVATFMVRYHAASRSLVAATHGRGMFRLSLIGRPLM
jgi:photosystem II stability/assembly factor-like uncharacterized protein